MVNAKDKEGGEMSLDILISRRHFAIKSIHVKRAAGQFNNARAHGVTAALTHTPEFRRRG